MDKNTKLLLGVGLVGVGAYMLWNQSKMKSWDAMTVAGVGRRMRNASGVKGLKMKKFVANELPARASTFNADGFKSSKAKVFSADGFKPSKEKVLNYSGKGFFKVGDSGWQG